MGTFSVVSDSCLQNSLELGSRIMLCTWSLKGESESFPNPDCLHVMVHVAESEGPHSLLSPCLQGVRSWAPYVQLESRCFLRLHRSLD